MTWVRPLGWEDPLEEGTATHSSILTWRIPQTLLICKTCHGSCMIQFSSVQFSSVAQSCPTHCDPMDCGTTGLPVHHQLPEFTQTHVHWVGDAIQLSHPLSSPSPPAFNLSQHQGLFQWVSSLHKVAKVLEFQLQHRPSNKYSGPVSFRMDWLDLLVVQGTLKSLLQHIWLRKQKHRWI